MSDIASNIAHMETFTIREAAERCNVTYQLMRKRVDRGSIETVKRDGVRLIPRAELERVGLWPGSSPELSASVELSTLRQQLAEAHAELTELRPVPAQLEAERQARELAEQAMHQQRALAQAAAARLEEAEQRRVDVEESLQGLTEGGFVAGVRSLMRLRSREPQHGPEPRPAAA